MIKKQDKKLKKLMEENRQDLLQRILHLENENVRTGEEFTEKTEEITSIKSKFRDLEKKFTDEQK